MAKSILLIVVSFFSIQSVAGPGSTGFREPEDRARLEKAQKDRMLELECNRTGIGVGDFIDRQVERRVKELEKEAQAQQNCFLSSVEGMPLFELSGEAEMKDAFFWASRSCFVGVHRFSRSKVETVHYFTHHRKPSDPANPAYGGPGRIISVQCQKYTDYRDLVRYECTEKEIVYASRP